MATVVVQTQIKGAIEVDEENIIEFIEPLLGFEKNIRYIIFQTEEGPVYWLQSLDDVGVSFCLLSPFSAGLDPDYEISGKDAKDIAAEKTEDIAVYTVLILDNDPSKVRTNLRAPILICSQSNKAKQVVFNNGNLPVQYYLRQEEQSKEDG